MKKDFLPIILGSDENAYGNCRLLYEAYGVRPLVLCSRRLVPTQHSRAADFELIENFDEKEVFEKELLRILKRESENYEKTVVIPCSDYYVTLLAETYDSFGGMIANRFISKELLSELEKKHRFYSLCEKYGLECPPSYVTTVEDCLSAPELASFGFPLVVKPENSNATDYLNVKFDGKKKVYIFQNGDEYRTVMSNLQKSGYSGKLILQKFISGSDENSYVVNAYCSSKGNVTLMAMGQAVLEEYAPKTLGNYAAIISRQNDELLNKVKNFLEELKYVGFANFDFKRDTETGKFYVLELNPRLGRSSFFAYSAGVNFMQAIVDDCVYGKESNPTVAEKTALWSNVPIGVLKKYVSDAALSKELKQLRKKGVSRTLFWKRDISPARLYRISKYYLMQYRNYKKYFFKK